jgi:hypothetical protein
MKDRLVITVLQADLAFEHYNFTLKNLYFETGLDFKKYRSSFITSFKFKPVWNETLSFDITNEKELRFDIIHKGPDQTVIIYLNKICSGVLKTEAILQNGYFEDSIELFEGSTRVGQLHVKINFKRGNRKGLNTSAVRENMSFSFEEG